MPDAMKVYRIIAVQMPGVPTEADFVESRDNLDFNTLQEGKNHSYTL